MSPSVPAAVKVAAYDTVIDVRLLSALQNMKARLKGTRGPSRFYMKAAIAMVESAQTLSKMARPSNKTSKRTSGRGSAGDRASSMPKANP